VCKKVWRKNQVKIAQKAEKPMNTRRIDGGKIEYTRQLGVSLMMNKGVIVVLLWMVQW
jgi:hypothetical protein